MLTKADIVKSRDEIIAIAQRYGASDIRVFGSVARGDATEDSDLAVLVRLESGARFSTRAGVSWICEICWGLRLT